MAYETSNPPALIAQRIGGTPAIWAYADGDDLATVLGAGYISDGQDLGMQAGDKVYFYDQTNDVSFDLVVDTVSTSATLKLSGANSFDVESVTTATLAPTADQSGTVFLLNRAAGITITLPAPVVGLQYTFVVQTAVTSNDYGMDTDAATTFLLGVIQQVIAASATSEGQVGNGTSHVSLNMNGTTTGGLAGSYHKVRAVSSTVWQVEGIHVGSGTLATGFAT